MKALDGDFIFKIYLKALSDDTILAEDSLRFVFGGMEKISQ